MDQSSSTTDPPLSPASVAPLTQSGKDGVLYKRHEDVDAEIAEILTQRAETWLIETLKDETLVHLVRVIRPSNDMVLLGKMIDELGRRIARIVRTFSAGLSKSEALDFAADVAAQLNCFIFATTPSRQSDFLEVAFGTAVKRRAINERTKIKNRKRLILLESSLSSNDSDEDGVGVVAFCADEKPDPEQRVIEAERHRLNPERAQKALAAISNPLHREAFILHVQQGWPIDGTATMTLSMHFGMSGRQIQNWINAARREMRTALGDDI